MKRYLLETETIEDDSKPMETAFTSIPEPSKIMKKASRFNTAMWKGYMIMLDTLDQTVDIALRDGLQDSQTYTVQVASLAKVKKWLQLRVEDWHCINVR